MIHHSGAAPRFRRGTFGAGPAPRKWVFLILAAALVSLGLAIYSIYSQAGVAGTNELDMYLTVEDIYGVNVDASALYFGAAPPGSTPSRNITLESNFSFPARVEIRAFGQLSKWTVVTENNFILQPSESRMVAVGMKIPEGAAYGNYTGKLKVVFRRV